MFLILKKFSTKLKIYNALLKYFLTGEKVPPPNLNERVEIMKRNFEKLIECKGENVAIREMRAHAAWYTKGLKGGAELRKNFNCAENVPDFEKIFNKINS